MIYEINIHDDVVNDKFKSFVFDNTLHSEYFLYGGAGAGKSYAVAQHILFKFLMNDYYRVMYVRKCKVSIRQSQFLLFTDLIRKYQLNELIDIRETDMTIYNKYNGNIMIAVGLDDTEKIKSIQGVNVAWIEEATEISEHDYLQVRARLREGDTHTYTICTFNPVSVNNWLYKYIRIKPNIFTMHATVDDNEFVNADYINVLEQSKLFNENFYDVYRLGKWGQEDEVKVLSNFEIRTLQEIEYDCFGIDFGWVNPTAVVGVRIDKDKREIYVREILYSTRIDVEMIYSKIRAIVRDTPIYADSAEAEMIDTLYLKGLNIHRAIKDVRYGLARLQSFKLIIDDTSENLIREVSSYSFQKDRNDNVVELPIKKDDHLVDALRYAVVTHLDKYADDGNTIIIKQN